MRSIRAIAEPMAVTRYPILSVVWYVKIPLTIRLPRIPRKVPIIRPIVQYSFDSFEDSSSWSWITAVGGLGSGRGGGSKSMSCIIKNKN